MPTGEDISAVEKDRKLQILDIMVVIVLFITACIVGKLVMNVYDAWRSFNEPALGILAVGELVWWRVRKRIKKKWEEG